MKTNGEWFPQWKTIKRVQLNSMNDARNLEYKYVMTQGPVSSLNLLAVTMFTDVCYTGV